MIFSKLDWKKTIIIYLFDSKKDCFFILIWSKKDDSSQLHDPIAIGYGKSDESEAFPLLHPFSYCIQNSMLI